MANQTSTPTQPRKIIIRPWPFNSPIAQTLVNALDNELEEMYPDWETLPHPGFAKFVGGDHGHEPEHRTNPIPVLDALDANDPNTNTGPVPPITSTQDITPTDLSTLHFHIAFDITDIPSTTTSTLSTNPGTPIACIGLSPMPYFPSHRHFPSLPAHPPSNPYPRPRHAEIKRLYIHPSYRGPTQPALQITTPTPIAPQTKLATALISTVQDFARTRLGVDKIVLETGVRQKAAVKLYERMGWTRIEEYGDYVGAGVKDGGVSMCYILDL